MNDKLPDDHMVSIPRSFLSSEHLSLMCDYVLSLSSHVAADGQFHYAQQMRDDAYQALDHQHKLNALLTGEVPATHHAFLSPKQVRAHALPDQLQGAAAVAELQALTDPFLSEKVDRVGADLGRWISQRAAKVLASVGIQRTAPAQLNESNGMPLGVIAVISSKPAPLTSSWQNLPQWLNDLAPDIQGDADKMAFIERVVRDYREGHKE